jgi:hypothetical protein
MPHDDKRAEVPRRSNQPSDNRGKPIGILHDPENAVRLEVNGTVRNLLNVIPLVFEYLCHRMAHTSQCIDRTVGKQDLSA